MKELTSQGINSFRIWDGVVCPGKPQAGISKAHKQIVQFAKDHSLSEILIGEDDLRFTAPGAFDYFLSQKPKEFDLYLGGLSHGKLSEDKIVKDFAGLLLYIIHHRFYDVFLSISEDKHLDRALKFKGKYGAVNILTVVSSSIT